MLHSSVKNNFETLGDPTLYFQLSFVVDLIGERKGY